MDEISTHSLPLWVLYLLLGPSTQCHPMENVKVSVSCFPFESPWKSLSHKVFSYATDLQPAFFWKLRGRSPVGFLSIGEDDNEADCMETLSLQKLQDGRKGIDFQQWNSFERWGHFLLNFVLWISVFNNKQVCFDKHVTKTHLISFIEVNFLKYICIIL